MYCLRVGKMFHWCLVIINLGVLGVGGYGIHLGPLWPPTLMTRLS